MAGRAWGKARQPLPKKFWIPALAGAGVGAGHAISREAGKTERAFTGLSEQRDKAVQAKEKAEAGPQDAGQWWDFVKKHPYATGGAVAAPIAAYALWKLLSKKDEEEEDPRARMY